MSTQVAVDQAFWQQCFKQHAAFLLRVVERMSGPGAHVEDIVQETFLTAHRRAEQAPEGAALRGWLYRICVHHVWHHRRSLARFLRLRERIGEEPTEIFAAPPDQPLQAAENARLVQHCVQALPPKLREIFVLYELEELSSVDIAELTDLSQFTVRSRLRKARERFRIALVAAQQAAEGIHV
jgi:RNA polymerase sigma-70 factor (ECF subfamily)